MGVERYSVPLHTLLCPVRAVVGDDGRLTEVSVSFDMPPDVDRYGFRWEAREGSSRLYASDLERAAVWLWQEGRKIEEGT